MGAKLGSGGGPMADINVTPLIDVVLVLLVVFMVITPMLSSGLPVDLPMATQSVTVNDAGQFVVISVTEDKGWWVDQEEVFADNIVEVVKSDLFAKPKTADGTDRAILIKADRDLSYGEVREVMDILSEAGFTNLLLAAGKEGG